MTNIVRKTISIRQEYMEPVQRRLMNQTRSFSNYVQSLIRRDLESDQHPVDCARPGCPQTAGEQDVK